MLSFLLRFSLPEISGGGGRSPQAPPLDPPLAELSNGSFVSLREKQSRNSLQNRSAKIRWVSYLYLAKRDYYSLTIIPLDMR